MKKVIYSHQAHPHTKPNGPRCTKIWENRPSAPNPRKSMIHRTQHKRGESDEETELRKADRTVGVNCTMFSNISSGTA